MSTSPGRDLQGRATEWEPPLHRVDCEACGVGAAWRPQGPEWRGPGRSCAPETDTAGSCVAGINNNGKSNGKAVDTRNGSSTAGASLHAALVVSIDAAIAAEHYASAKAKNPRALKMERRSPRHHILPCKAKFSVFRMVPPPVVAVLARSSTRSRPRHYLPFGHLRPRHCCDGSRLTTFDGLH